MLKFIKSTIRNPLQVGAIAPSSPYLGRAMAKLALQHPDLDLIELGPGTGPITTELLQAGVSPSQMTLVEMDEEFGAVLRSKFPALDIVIGDGADYLSSLPVGPSRVVVSSLPLLSFKKEARAEMGKAIAHAIGKSGRLVQFTYGQFNPLRDELNLHGKRVEFVLRNAPPAWIWSYRQTSLKAIKG